MKQTIWKFGLWSAAVSSGFMLIEMPFMEKIGNAYAGWIIGYASIVLSFLLVYFGIRSYRDRQNGGEITFGKAFGVGILITLISCAAYVLVWEVSYFTFFHGIMDNYGANVIHRMQAAGASPAAIQAKMAELAKDRQAYENPLYNSAITFLEPFPVGLIITLISAALLRRKSETTALQTA